MIILGWLLLTFGFAGMVSIALVAPYKPRSLSDYLGLVFRHLGITSLVIVFALAFALGIVLLVGG